MGKKVATMGSRYNRKELNWDCPTQTTPPVSHEDIVGDSSHKTEVHGGYNARHVLSDSVFTISN